MENNLKEIKEFITLWKERAIDYYTKKITYYHNEYRKLNHYMCDFHNHRYEIMRERNLTDDEYKKEYDENERKYKDFKNEMVEEITKDFALNCFYYPLNNCLERMVKKIEKDAVAKEVQLIARVNREVGCIIKPNALYVGVNGELNGYIEGENGVCKIETIYAGGYNIQCLHYRVLIHKVTA